MIVYGDPSEQESFRSLVERLRDSLSAARQGSLDDARAVLIGAGMLEQAVEDADDEALIAPCRVATDFAAEAFITLYRPERGRLVRSRHADASSALDLIPNEDPSLTVKLPEGFAFYALYPESYVTAAERWLANHLGDSEPLSPLGERGRGEGQKGSPRGATMLVIGVRSIGTTLSAVVTATLRAHGVDVHRLTLRPTGHPFAREAHLATASLQGADHALIVDEGPGLSGSSMAAAAQAALDAGIPRDRIAFLPGHGNDPGGMASDAVRRWWRETPRVVTPTESLRWEGRTLEETLTDHAGNAVAAEELTGGRWRERAYADEADWPPVALPFERRKLLVTRADGSHVLYKFVGLSEPGAVLGFAPAPWIDGQPLTAADATQSLLAQIARHIAAVAGPPLSPKGSQAAQERLTHLLRHNAEEAGLPPLPLPPLQDKPLEEGVPSAGDYRLAPHEWRRLPDGTVQKTNRRPPTGDHTAVGAQPIAWDVAGAMVEWNLDETSAKSLIEALAAENITTTIEERRFYRAAYAAFMMGLCAHCAPLAPEAERPRLEAVRDRYRQALLEAGQTTA